jgi:hypothetical protein
MYPSGTVVLAGTYFNGSGASKVELAIAQNGIKDWVAYYLVELLDEIFIRAITPMNQIPCGLQRIRST